MLLVLVVLIALFSVLGPAVAGRSFFNFPNLLTMLNQNAYLVILGVGITFIMLGGGMDLSTGFLISTVGMVYGAAGGLLQCGGCHYLRHSAGSAVCPPLTA